MVATVVADAGRPDSAGLRPPPPAGTRAGRLGAMVSEVDRAVTRLRPAAIVVQGDTTSALAGALVANGCDIPLVHVEAGLRSYDRRMPEEHHRKVIDHLADLCCVPNALNHAQLIDEGLPPERIAITGNTIVEVLAASLPNAVQRGRIRRSLGLTEGDYVLSTFHRPENVDDPAVLAAILLALAELPVPVLLPVHPRTRRRIGESGLAGLADRLMLTSPLPYPTFLALFHGALLAVSDSGGVQEEASVLKRPVVVVRRSTERPEILGTFGVLVPPGDRLGGTLRVQLDNAADRQVALSTVDTPHGDGNASQRIVTELDALLASGVAPPVPSRHPADPARSERRRPGGGEP